MTTEGQFEVAMGKPGIGQHFDDEVEKGDGAGGLEVVTAENIQEGEAEEVFVGVGGVVE